MKKIDATSKNWSSVPQVVEEKMPLLLAIWLFLAVLAPHQEMYKVYFHIIVVPAIIVLFFNKNIRSAYKDPLLFTALTFFGYAALATFFTDFGTTQSQIRAIRWTVEASFCLLAFWVWMPNVIKRKEWWSKYLLLITFLAGLAAILNFWLFQNFEGRLTGFGGLHNPIQISSVLIILMAIIHFMLVTNKKTDNIQQQISFIATAIIVFAAVFFSESRGPIGAMLIYIAFLAILNLLTGIDKKHSLFLLLIPLLGSLAFIFIEETRHYIDDLLSRGMSYRLDIWYGYFNFPPDTWWLGFGLDNEPKMLPAVNAYWEPNNIVITHPHSIFLGTLFETGIIGTLFLLFMCIMIITMILKTPHSSKIKIRLLGLLFLITLLGLTTGQGVIYSVKTYWIIIWFPIVYIWMWCKLNKI